MSTDNFQWTDELVKEFYEQVYCTPSINPEKDIEDFKASKQPKPDEHWEQELNKCKTSPYYFYTKYMTVNGKPCTTGLSEQHFNDYFFKVIPDYPQNSKQPKQERIEVLSMAIKKQWGDGKIDFECQLSYGISKDLFPAIKQAIESVLNKDTEDKDSIKVRASYWKQVQDDLRFLEAELDANQDKIYTQSEVDTIRREEGLYWFREGYKYSRSFTSKIPYDEIAELTVVNAFNEISSLNSKEEKPEQPLPLKDKELLFTNDFFEIPFNLALDMCIGIINTNVSYLAAVGKCNNDFDDTRKNIIEQIAKLKK